MNVYEKLQKDIAYAKKVIFDKAFVSGTRCCRNGV